MPSLYVVATPIGNLEDISLRALRILGQVKLIAAEDTRTTRNLLNKYDIKTALTSYHEHNKRTKLDYLINVLKENDIALVSEAGTPGFNDPGYELINRAVELSIPVVPIPGASAILNAALVSGLPVDKFVFLGFLPRRRSERLQFLKKLVNETKTMVIFEAPHRLQGALADIVAVLGNRRMAVCRELTKVHEEIFRGTVSQAVEHFNQPRGEFTLVVEGVKEGEKEVDENIEHQLRRLYRRGVSARDAVSELSISGISKKRLYKLWLTFKKESEHA